MTHLSMSVRFTLKNPGPDHKLHSEHFTYARKEGVSLSVICSALIWDILRYYNMYIDADTLNAELDELRAALMDVRIIKERREGDTWVEMEGDDDG